MKKFSFLLILILLFVSCDKKSKSEQEIEEIPIELEVQRFEKEFYSSKPEELASLKEKFPDFFPPGNEDYVWIEKMNDTLQQEFNAEVQKKFSDFSKQTFELEELFRHIKYYFPNVKIPKVITTLSDFDPNTKAIYTKDYLIIPLDLYLGSEHRFYEDFPNYQKFDFSESHLLPNVVGAFSAGLISLPKDKTLLSQMVYFGKKMYLSDLLIPKISDADKIGYTPEQITWSQENEGFIWRYFIDENLLYDSDPKLSGRFINPAPFSKFYLEIDNESPGRIGVWVGWQIVRSYMKNNDVSLQQLLQTDAKEIFDNSKYKPKK